MPARLAMLAVGAVFALPSVAAAQGDDDEWAAGLGGHLAFLTQSQDDGISMFQMFGPDGQRSVQAPVSDRYASPAVAVGPRGDAIFLWYDRDERLWARYRSAGGVLGADEFVADTVGAGSESNVLALDAAGTATVTYVPDPDEAASGLHVRTRSEAGVWSAAQNLGGREIFAPRLAVTPNGSAVLAWRQSADPKRLNANQLAVSTRGPGAAGFGPVSALSGVHTDPSPSSVAANDQGDAVVGWSLYSRRSGFVVYAYFRDRHGAFGPRVKLNRTRDMAGPWATVLPNGRMVLGWTDNIKRRAEARVRLASGKLGPVKKVTEDLEQNSDLFALAVGRGALAWSDRDPGVSTLRIADTAADGRFLAPRTVTRFRGWTVGPAFAVGPQGPVAVASRPLRPANPIRWLRVPPS